MKTLTYNFLFLSICFLIFYATAFGQSFGSEQDFSKVIPLPDNAYKILLKSDQFIRDSVEDVKTEG